MAQRNFERIDTNGVTLETVVEGDGPLVILLHGWPQCWYLWRHQIDPIGPGGAPGSRRRASDARHFGRHALHRIRGEERLLHRGAKGARVRKAERVDFWSRSSPGLPQ